MFIKYKDGGVELKEGMRVKLGGLIGFCKKFNIEFETDLGYFLVAIHIVKRFPDLEIEAQSPKISKEARDAIMELADKSSRVEAVAYQWLEESLDSMV